jgi:hypothetical protein
MKKILSIILFITLICSSQAFSRNFPSKFMPWIPCGNDPTLTVSGQWEWLINLTRDQFPPGYPAEESDEAINFMIRASQYDLSFTHPYTMYDANGYPFGPERILGMAWDHQQYPFAGTNFTPDSIARGLKRKAYMKQMNPDLKFIMDFHWTMVHEKFLPPDHPWWFRDENGNRVVKFSDTWYQNDGTGITEYYYYMDIHNQDYINHLVQRALAAVNSGVYDGVLIDCAIDYMWESWQRGVNNDPTHLIASIRAAFGPDKIITVNSTYNFVPQWAPYINGVFMEGIVTNVPGCEWGVASNEPCFSDEIERWRRIEDSINNWHFAITHQPKIIALEVQTPNRLDVAEMRAATTLSMTHTDGYIMYTEPFYFPSHDHGHNWYSFWEADMGVPTSARIDRPDGAYQREYSNGTVIHNPVGNVPVAVTFPDQRLQASTGIEGYSFIVNGKDGDMFIKR